MKNSDLSTPVSVASPAAIRYQATHFINRVNALAQLPADTGREVAFAGRSNAGKSSALNVLTGQRQLARVSKTPGRTQLLNFFQVTPDRYLVDLPGYGYARVPEVIRRHWGALLERYLLERAALRGLMLLMDVRHPLTALDDGLLASCAHRQLPVHILLTKADKLSRGAATTALAQVLGYYRFTTATLFGAPVTLSRTGYTGEDGFEIYLSPEHAEAVWKGVTSAGAAHGLELIGLGARDTLRLEMGYMLNGNDITDSTTPLEAGLGWTVKLAKGDFMGRN